MGVSTPLEIMNVIRILKLKLEGRGQLTLQPTTCLLRRRLKDWHPTTHHCQRKQATQLSMLLQGSELHGKGGRNFCRCSFSPGGAMGAGLLARVSLRPAPKGTVL